MRVLVLGCSTGLGKKVVDALRAMEVQTEIVGIDTQTPEDTTFLNLDDFINDDIVSSDWNRYDLAVGKERFDRIYVCNLKRGNVDSIRNAAQYWMHNMTITGNAVRTANLTGATLVYLTDPEATDPDDLKYPDLETFYEGSQIVVNFAVKHFIATTEEEFLKYGC